MSEDSNNFENQADPQGADVGGGLPPSDRAELAALLRDLDAVGAARRAQLSSAAELRIFAASDLQLPLSTAEVRPVAGRIVPFRRNVVPTWARIAAAIAVVGALAAGAIVLSRGVVGVDETGAPAGRMLAEGDATPSDGANANAALPASPEHFELALAFEPPQRASSLPARAVAAALDSPKHLAYSSLARIDASEFASAAGPELAASHEGGLNETGFGFDDAIDLDFDGLSGEFAAIVSRSASAF
ncbi:MAG: hypothetical protein ACKO3W_06765 [bacterium]